MIRHTREDLLSYAKREASFLFGPDMELVHFQFDTEGSFLSGENPLRSMRSNEIWEQFKITKREMDEIVSKSYGCELSDVSGFWRTARGLRYPDLVEILLELQELVPTPIITTSNKRHKIV